MFYFQNAHSYRLKQKNAGYQQCEDTASESLYLDFYPAVRNPETMIMSRREYLGIGDTTDDRDYFVKHGNSFFSGSSDFKRGIFREKSTYLDIGENGLKHIYIQMKKGYLEIYKNKIG